MGSLQHPIRPTSSYSISAQTPLLTATEYYMKWVGSTNDSSSICPVLTFLRSINLSFKKKKTKNLTESELHKRCFFQMPNGYGIMGIRGHHSHAVSMQLQGIRQKRKEKKKEKKNIMSLASLLLLGLPVSKPLPCPHSSVCLLTHSTLK